MCLYRQVKLGLLTWQSGRKEKKRQTEAKFINSRPRLLTRIVSRGRFFLKPRRSGQTAFAFDYSGKKIKIKCCNFLVSCEKKFTEYKQCKCFIFHKCSQQNAASFCWCTGVRKHLKLHLCISCILTVTAESAAEEADTSECHLKTVRLYSWI